jgi:hypothetical protein
MADVRVDVTRVVPARTRTGPKGHGRSHRWAVVVLAFLLMTVPSATRAQSHVCFFPEAPTASAPYHVTDYLLSKCNTELTWPTTWTAVGAVSEVSGDESQDFNDLISKNGYQGLWVARQPGFIFFRARVNYPTAVIPTTGSPYIFGTGT